MVSQSLNDGGKVASVFREVEVFDKVGRLLIMLRVVGVNGVGDILMWNWGQDKSLRVDVVYLIAFQEVHDFDHMMVLLHHDNLKSFIK